VRRAEAAVNDTCGDIDIVRDVEHCVQVVTRKQKEDSVTAEDLASVSEIMSSESTSFARLYARVLEMDMQDSNAVSYDVILSIVNEVLYDNHNDDSSSTGTIDEDSCTLDESTLPAGKDEQSKCQSQDDTTNEDSQVSTGSIPGHPNRKQSATSASSSGVETAGVVDHQSESGRSINLAIASLYAGTKRSFEPGEDESTNDLVWKAPPSETGLNVRRRTSEAPPSETGRNVRQRTSDAMEETRDRCNVAHALICLARWEFRAHSIVPKP
jgi:hypothetical protein